MADGLGPATGLLVIVAAVELIIANLGSSRSARWLAAGATALFMVSAPFFLQGIETLKTDGARRTIEAYR